MEDVDISVVVPTRNERNNVRPLLGRLCAALSGRRAEVIVIDDSTDDTPEVAAEAAKESSLRVLVMHRGPGERVGGLSGAVVTGLRLAAGRTAVVMDGDLQHPPEVIPELVAPVEDGDADVVVASRYRDQDGLDGLSGRARVGVSRLATALTRALFPGRLRNVTDPMSGFFALRLSAVDLDSLRPIGFKILLETVARSRASVHEIGFTFGPRLHGDSKASVGEGVRFLRHLVRLRTDTMLTARQRRAAGFALVGASGLVVNTVAFWALLHYGHIPYILAAALSTQVSTTWNFAGMELFVFATRRYGRFWPRYLKFCLLNNTAMLARLPVLAFLVSVLHCPKTLANFLTLLLVFVVRFGISDRYIYEAEAVGSVADLSAAPEVGPVVKMGPVRIVSERPVDAFTATAPEPAGVEGLASVSGPPLPEFRHFYDVHSILTIGSDVLLPELGYFLRPNLAGSGITPDIGIRVGAIGRPRLRTQLVRSTDARTMRWEEHFGRLSANFSIDFGPPISITASRTLARSPHVLYTNVVEALLRFVFVERGFMLLHAACMDVGGRGVMLSARTDTGKTGTVLKLLRASRGSFLSDDMTIVDGSGVARNFPKPLTISHHTLHSVDAGELTQREWAWLRVQSRLHSKEGRGFALKLAEHNVPIMTVNGWTQRLVPPPKYPVQRLVPCRYATETTIDRLYIIERGVPHHSVVPKSQAIEEMLENTEDAYGFPPYRYLSQSLSVNGLGYDELKERERLILVSAMESVEVHRLGSNDFSWADRIAEALVPGLESGDLLELESAGAPVVRTEARGTGAVGNGNGSSGNGIGGPGGNGAVANGAPANGPSGDDGISANGAATNGAGLGPADSGSVGNRPGSNGSSGNGTFVHGVVDAVHHHDRPADPSLPDTGAIDTSSGGD